MSLNEHEIALLSPSVRLGDSSLLSFPVLLEDSQTGNAPTAGAKMTEFAITVASKKHTDIHSRDALAGRSVSGPLLALSLSLSLSL